jgi:hypothetical protein
VRLLAGDKELGGVTVGLERVGGDHHAAKVQPVQQRPQGGNFARRAVDLALGQHGAGGVIHRGEQMDLPALSVPGAPQRLAVDGDRPPSTLPPGPGTVTVDKPRADRCGQRRGVHAGEGPADRGLGRHRPPVGCIATCAERGTHRLRGVGGPLGNRGHRPGTGQDRGGGYGKDRDQRMPAAATPSRVVDGGEVGEQVWGIGRLQGVGVGEWGEGGWEGG